FAKKHPEVRFINTTEGGLGFKGSDYVPLVEAVQGFKQCDLRALVHEKISATPMPAGTDEQVAAKMDELKESLHRLIGHLEILAEEKKGSSALAEMDLKEEIAFLYLFYDIYHLFSGPDLWRKGLDL